jgi:hypothetical protein
VPGCDVVHLHGGQGIVPVAGGVALSAHHRRRRRTR